MNSKKQYCIVASVDCELMTVTLNVTSYTISLSTDENPPFLDLPGPGHYTNNKNILCDL